MKKTVKRIFSMLLIGSLILSFTACGKSEKKETPKTTLAEAETTVAVETETETAATEEETVTTTAFEGYHPLNYEYMKGVWLYQYTENGLFRDGINGQRDIDDYTDRVTKIVTNLERDGFNTLFLQVRPYGDSFYPSDYYCPTNFVTYGYDTDFDYDPIEIFVRIAHEHNISIHAWINPMRLMLARTIEKVPGSYLIKKWYNEEEGTYIVKVDGRYYLNPSYEETRQLVIDGAVEICRKYDIDGIHLDDYFYPDGAENNFDNEAYLDMGKGDGLTRDQFRFQSVNKLVKGLYQAVHAVNPYLLFGISPAGNINNNLGYLHADVVTWCKEDGYIDYIAPQVYWSFDYSRDFAKYDICSESWGKLIKTDSVRLILGTGLYRAVKPEYSETDPGWYKYKDNIKRMLEYAADYDLCSGWILFDYASMYSVVNGDYNSAIDEERENFLPVMKAEESVPIKYN